MGCSFALRGQETRIAGTLCSHPKSIPARGADTPPAAARCCQEGGENYFAPPYPLAKQFMDEVTALCWEMNIPIKVNHNEVAPSQHELSPVFSIATVSSDSNMACMDVMDEVAAKLGLKVCAPFLLRATNGPLLCRAPSCTAWLGP